MTDHKRIQSLNDAFRQSMSGGKVLTTASLADHPQLGAILHRVRTYSDFTEANDPYGEHDFGSFTIGGEKLFWKIDLYEDETVKDKNDPRAADRVLTIMRASEY